MMLLTNGLTKMAETANTYKMFVAPSGSLVYIGRNRKENDELTFKFASIGDLWFHVADFPGAHVLMKHSSTGNNSFSTHDIHYAALLAKQYSKCDAKRAKVTWCDVSLVHKPKHAPFGMVIVHGTPNILSL
jgi:predicted ribosome quality control (RQC) complex YloA/Tae2 family protein